MAETGWIPSKLVAYILLFAAIVFEIVATAFLAASQQFTKPMASALTIVTYGLTYYIFAFSIKTIPVGLAYGVWSAAGVVLLLAWGAVAYRQVPDAPAVIGSLLIVAGVIIANGFSEMEA